MDSEFKSLNMNPLHYNGALTSHIVDDPENQIIIATEITIPQELIIKKSCLTKSQFEKILILIFLIFSIMILVLGVYMFIDAEKRGYQMVTKHHYNNSDKIVCRGQGCIERGFSLAIIIIGSMFTSICLCLTISYCQHFCNNFYNQLDD